MNDTKRKIIRSGGIHEITFESGGSFLDWLTFLTNPLNLEPGLPDLTLIPDSRAMDDSAIKVSFERQRASLSSLKMHLDCYMGDLNSLFEDPDNEPIEIIRLIECETSKPRYLRKWLFNLALHPGLEELHFPFRNAQLTDWLAQLDNRRQSRW